jgi:hypothetical protein
MTLWPALRVGRIDVALDFNKAVRDEVSFVSRRHQMMGSSETPNMSRYAAS